MEVPRDELTPEKYQEMEDIAKENVCAECGAPLQIHTVPETNSLRVGCLNRAHTGWVEKETYTQMHRRGEEVHPVVRDNIERHMLPKEDLNRALNLLALRYPHAIKNPAQAALFIADCYRLDLDPMISPPEAVPVTFKSKKKLPGGAIKETHAVVMIVTGDGWLSMAARGCKEDYVGPPRTMRLEEYLAAQPENAKRSREELAAIASDIKKSDSGDPDAWAYVAVGRRRGGEDTAVPGFFTHADRDDAKEKRLPAATSPGNQARMRAIKRWVREVFPDARQRMLTLSEEWYRRSEGVQEAQQLIDAEYRMIETRGERKLGARTGEGGPGAEKSGATNFREQKGEGRQKPGGAQAGAAAAGESRQKPAKDGGPAAAGGAEEWPPGGEPVSDEQIVGDGFRIDLQWLTEAMQLIKWSDDTAKSWLATKFGVETKGNLKNDVLPRCTKEQAEAFVREVQARAAKLKLDL